MTDTDSRFEGIEPIRLSLSPETMLVLAPETRLLPGFADRHRFSGVMATTPTATGAVLAEMGLRARHPLLFGIDDGLFDSEPARATGFPALVFRLLESGPATERNRAQRDDSTHRVHRGGSDSLTGRAEPFATGSPETVSAQTLPSLDVRQVADTSVSTPSRRSAGKSTPTPPPKQSSVDTTGSPISRSRASQRTVVGVGSGATESVEGQARPRGSVSETKAEGSSSVPLSTVGDRPLPVTLAHARGETVVSLTPESPGGVGVHERPTLEYQQTAGRFDPPVSQPQPAVDSRSERSDFLQSADAVERPHAPVSPSSATETADEPVESAQKARTVGRTTLERETERRRSTERGSPSAAAMTVTVDASPQDSYPAQSRTLPSGEQFVHRQPRIQRRGRENAPESRHTTGQSGPLPRLQEAQYSVEELQTRHTDETTVPQTLLSRQVTQTHRPPQSAGGRPSGAGASEGPVDSHLQRTDDPSRGLQPREMVQPHTAPTVTDADTRPTRSADGTRGTPLQRTAKASPSPPASTTTQPPSPGRDVLRTRTSSGTEPGGSSLEATERGPTALERPETGDSISQAPLSRQVLRTHGLSTRAGGDSLSRGRSQPTGVATTTTTGAGDALDLRMHTPARQVGGPPFSDPAQPRSRTDTATAEATADEAGAVGEVAHPPSRRAPGTAPLLPVSRGLQTPPAVEHQSGQRRNAHSGLPGSTVSEFSTGERVHRHTPVAQEGVDPVQLSSVERQAEGDVSTPGKHLRFLPKQSQTVQTDTASDMPTLTTHRSEESSTVPAEQPVSPETGPRTAVRDRSASTTRREQTVSPEVVEQPQPVESDDLASKRVERRSAQRSGHQTTEGSHKPTPLQGRETDTLYPDLSVKTLAPRVDETNRSVTRKDITRRESQPRQHTEAVEITPEILGDSSPGHTSIGSLAARVQRELDRKMRMDRERRGL